MTNTTLAVNYTREFSKAAVSMLAALAQGYEAVGRKAAPKSRKPEHVERYGKTAPVWLYAETARKHVRCSFRKVEGQVSVVAKKGRELHFGLNRRGAVTISALRLLGQVQ